MGIGFYNRVWRDTFEAALANGSQRRGAGEERWGSARSPPAPPASGTATPRNELTPGSEHKPRAEGLRVLS